MKISHSPMETMEAASSLGEGLKAGDVVALIGEIGAGKTVFTKGIALSLKVDPDDVHSPTFTIMNEYQGRLPVYHVDFYRIDDVCELERLGFVDYLSGDGVTIVEWADRAMKIIPESHILVKINFIDEESREIEVAWTRGGMGESASG